MSFPYVLTLHQAPTDGADYTRLSFPHRVSSAAAQAASAEVPRRTRDRRRQLPERHAARGKGSRAAARVGRPLQGGACVTRVALLEPMLALHDAVRDDVRGGDGASATRRAGRGRSRRSRRHDLRHRRRSARRSSADSPTSSRASTLSFWLPRGCPGDRRAFPHGTDEAAADWRIIVDPIDGTRGLMYQKRSAWILTGVAPNRGPATSLRDIVLAVQTEIPLRQAAPVGSVVGDARDGGAHGATLQPADRRACTDPAARRRRPRPSRTATRRSPASSPARATSWRRSTRRSCSARLVRVRPARRTASRISTPRPAGSCTS